MCLHPLSSWSPGEVSGVVASGGLNRQGLRWDQGSEMAGGHSAGSYMRPLVKSLCYLEVLQGWTGLWSEGLGWRMQASSFFAP